MSKIHKILFEKGLLDKDQFKFLEVIDSGQLTSVYFDLRSLLYLGILLFSGGVGYIAYENIGEVGHVFMMLCLLVLILCGGYFIHLKYPTYNHQSVKVDHAYVDYLVVLQSLLIISLFTYVQVYYDLVEYFINWTTGITALVFFFMAFRYDNKAVLSLAITALAAVFGLSISPVNWVSGEFQLTVELYIVAVVLGMVLVATGIVLKKMDIKAHFEFTFVNFGLLLFLLGGLTLVFDNYDEVLLGVLFTVFGIALVRYTWVEKRFLFFLYACLFSYTLISYLFIRLLMLGDGDGVVLAFYYFPLSCLIGVWWLVSNRTHFSDD